MHNAKTLAFASADTGVRPRWRTTVFAAVDYAVNILILFGFAAASTISYQVAFAMLAIILAFNLVFVVSILSGATQRLGDPSMTGVQIFAACGVNLIGLLLAPHIAYMFIVNLFVPLSYGSVHFTQRTYLFAWFLLSCALGFALRIVGGQIDIAVATSTERWLFWAVVAVALGRFLAINAEVSRLRMHLHERNKELGSMAMKLSDLASRDELTGLWNRREFMRLLSAERRRAERQQSGFCVALLDADHFKQVNDRFGHLIGDAVLQELAKEMEGRRRMTDSLARYGGEEFTLLLLDHQAQAASVALERIRLGIEQNDWGRLAAGLRVTVSAGIAAWRPGEDVAQTLNRADVALYDAKSAGRNCIRIAPE